ncbi:penicillin-binding transpeptidase domain-containing protein [Sunxiuqinia elliptica]
MEIRKDITARFGVIYFLAAMVGVIIVVKIFMIQNMDTEKWKGIAKDLKNNTTEIPAKRGNICADDGSILATSVPQYELRLDLAAPRVKRIYGDKSDDFALEVAKFFKISKSQFKRKLDKAFKDGNRWFLIYPEKVNYNQLQKFKRLSMLKKSIFGSGLIVITESERVMPHSELASRTIGTLNKGAFGGIHGNVGYSGIEGLMEGYLSGENGKAIKRNYSGRWINMPIVDPKDGSDVITTLNVNLQDFANNALHRQMETSQAQWGTAIVMEVKTGEVKAIANLGRRKDGTYGETYNFALGHAGCSEPGSTFKLMSLMAAMEHGYVDTSDVFDTGNGIWNYRGQTIYDSDYYRGGRGKLSMKRIFELSSNVGVAKIITEFYEGHEEDFIDRIYNFGLNKPLGLGFAGEGVPYIKYPDDDVWWGPSLAWISYGYEIKLTPLQTATFYNAVANNGRMIKPKFVKEVRRNGILEKEFKTEIINPSICSKGTLGKAQDLLAGVCTAGTGRSLNNPYFPIAGKTGTAQVAYNDQGYEKDGRKNYQASFAGYFPADDPQYTCVVVIVGPKGKYYGGSVAGPVFREIVSKVYASFMDRRENEDELVAGLPEVKAGFKQEIEFTAEELDLELETGDADSDLIRVKPEENRLTANSLQLGEGLVPDVRGMGGSDALYLLESAGLKVRMKGIGKVRKQSLKAGNKIRRGQTIYIDLG